LIGITSDRFICIQSNKTGSEMVLPCLGIFPPVIGKFYGYARVNLCRLLSVKQFIIL
jgi:hypothetical protein